MESDSQCRSLYLFQSSQSSSVATVRIEVFRITHEHSPRLYQTGERYEVAVFWYRLLEYVPRHYNTRMRQKIRDLCRKRLQKPTLNIRYDHIHHVELNSATRRHPTSHTRQERILGVHPSLYLLLDASL